MRLMFGRSESNVGLINAKVSGLEEISVPCKLYLFIARVSTIAAVVRLGLRCTTTHIFIENDVIF